MPLNYSQDVTLLRRYPFRHINPAPQQRPRQQYANHQELGCIETTAKIHYSSKKDRHEKSAGLTDKIHDPGNGPRAVTAHFHTRSETVCYDRRLKKMCC